MLIFVPTENLPAAHREAVVCMLESMIAAGLAAVATAQMRADAAEAGMDLPALSPDPGFLNPYDRDSGLCKLIRAAIKSKYLSGSEDFLETVVWR